MWQLMCDVAAAAFPPRRHVNAVMGGCFEEFNEEVLDGEEWCGAASYRKVLCTAHRWTR